MEQVSISKSRAFGLGTVNGLIATLVFFVSLIVFFFVGMAMQMNIGIGFQRVGLSILASLLVFSIGFVAGWRLKITEMKTGMCFGLGVGLGAGSLFGILIMGLLFTLAPEVTDILLGGLFALSAVWVITSAIAAAGVALSTITRR